MMKLGALFFCVLASVSLIYQVSANAEPGGAKNNSCIKIQGEYQHWEGHPPYERIKTKNGKLYGLISSFEDDGDFAVPQYPLPDNLQLEWNAHDDVIGQFDFCLVSNTAKFKAYELEPIELGWIKSFTPLDASPRADFIRKIQVAVINAQVSPHDLAIPGNATVSFDYLNGTASNARIDKSSGEAAFDKAALLDIEQTKFPVLPPEFKDQKLHVVVTIFFAAAN